MHFVFISSSDKNADILPRHQIYSDYFLSYTNRKVADFNLDFFSQSKNTRNTKTSAERGLFFAHCTKVFATFSLSFAWMVLLWYYGPCIEQWNCQNGRKIIFFYGFSSIEQKSICETRQYWPEAETSIWCLIFQPQRTFQFLLCLQNSKL